MDTGGAAAEAGALLSRPAIQPDRDLFQARTKPLTFTLTHRQRTTVSPDASGSRTTTASRSCGANFGRNAHATVRRHVTRAIILDPSTYANHSRYSQRQFDEESAAQDFDRYTEDHDVGDTLDFALNMERERQTRRRCRRQGPFSIRRRARSSRVGGREVFRRACERRGTIRRTRWEPARVPVQQRDGLPQMMMGCTAAAMESDVSDELSKLKFDEGVTASQQSQRQPRRGNYSGRFNYDAAPFLPS